MTRSKLSVFIFISTLYCCTCVTAANHRRLLTTAAPYNWQGANPEGANPETTTRSPSPSIVDNVEFDVLNQRTYDMYDWILYAFAICGFGCCCMCFGCFAHYRYIFNKIVSDEDIDVFPATAMAQFSGNTPTVATPGSRRFSFAGFNLFGERIRSPPAAPPRPKSEKVISASTSMAPVPGNIDVRHSLVAEIARELHTLQIQSDESPVRVTRSTTQLMHQLQLLSSTSADAPPPPPEPKYQPAPPSMDPDEDEDNTNEPHKIVRIMTNPDPKQRRKLPRIIVPAKDAAIVPKYREDVTTPTTDVSVLRMQSAVQTPDAYEPSQTHLSLQLGQVSFSHDAYGNTVTVNNDVNDDEAISPRKGTEFSIIKEEEESELYPSTPL
eukprot:CAMPEP_0202689380 /NCGR_PEP_ID=MMETSP1385-20130828/4652_1 /ASSEMBLY_ACC=CAM_ASM_000861 /TAXON_ID=933848 /ORGANISM="Elphidium margaritaceum" /LENGTH=380 /DNA_ID=CAMNT_0049344501 /DNA_START=37 /DNA_END=1179 /DNA_ORIENTATION=-